MSTLAVTGELTIFTAVAWHARFVEALAADEEGLRLDLSGVSEMDSAGLQLLIALSREAAVRGHALPRPALSPAVEDLLALCRLEDLFDAAPEAP